MREKPTEDFIYHVYNRGVDKRIIFNDDNDRERFACCLYFFNDKKSIDNLRFFDLESQPENDDREKLVEILSFVLMPNHFHLLLKPLAEDGVSEFMKKLGIGYTHYFNIKNERSGSLFQGKYKFVKIETEEQLLYIPYYIHFNPIELIEKNWKGKTIENSRKAFDFIKSYRWSSLLDYLGEDNFSKIIDKKFLRNYFENLDDLKKEILDWIEEIHSPTIKELSLE